MSDTTYFKTTDKNGTDLLCPLDDGRRRENQPPRDTAECVGLDVIGRYAGNIEVVG